MALAQASNDFMFRYGWKNGQYIDTEGYVHVKHPHHRRAHVDGYVLEHLLVAERAMGKSLPLGAEMHHVNGDKADNRSSNLVVCDSRAYHSLLHQRQRALKACDHAHWRKCNHCGEYDDPECM